MAGTLIVTTLSGGGAPIEAPDGINIDGAPVLTQGAPGSPTVLRNLQVLGPSSTFQVAPTTVGSLDNVNIGSNTPASAAFSTLVTVGPVIFGDSPSDPVTFNSSNISIPNNLSFDSNTLFIDATNNRIGVNNANPTVSFDVTGSGRFLGNLVYTGSLTGGSGILDIGGGQIYKNAAGSVFFGSTSGSGSAKYQFLGDDTNGYIRVNGATSTTFLGSSVSVTGSPSLAYSALRGLNGLILSGTGGSDFVLNTAGNFGFGTTNTLGFRGVFAESSGNHLALLKPVATSATERLRLRYYSSNTLDGGVYDLGGIDYLREDGGFGNRSSLVVTVKTGGGDGNLAEAARFTPTGNLLVGTAIELTGVRGVFANTQDTDQLAIRQITRGGHFGFSCSGINSEAISITDRQRNHVLWNAGTLGQFFSVDGVERVRITPTGNLLLGTTTDGGSRQTVSIPAAGDWISYQIGTTSIFKISETGTAVTLFAQDSAVDRALAFGTVGGERARIAPIGYLKASNTGSYGGVSGIGDISSSNNHVFQSDANAATVSVLNANTGSGANNINSFLATGAAGKHFRGAINNVDVFSVVSDGSVENATNSYGAISDETLKENIVDAPSYLSRFMQVRFCNFNFKENTGYETHKQFGVIAQELELIFPSLVTSTPNLSAEGNELGTVTKSVKFSVLTAIYGKVIQEQQILIENQNTVIQSQQDQITTLSESLADVLTRLDALESA